MEKSKQELLEDRLESFAFEVLSLVRSLPKVPENRIFGRQVIRSSSSIGANYTEATCATSRRDFVNDLNRSRKEAKESFYWLRLIVKANTNFKEQMQGIIMESQEIYKILNSSVKTAKDNLAADAFSKSKILNPRS